MPESEITSESTAPTPPELPAALLAAIHANLAELKRIREAMEGVGIEPEGMSPAQAARYLGISTAKYHAMNASGELGPEPALLGCGNCPRASRTELRAWLLAGAPTRGTWRLMRDTAMKRIA